MTSLYTAAARAKESSLAENQRRFNDPLASKLARPIMKTFLEHKVHEGDGEKVTGLHYLAILLPIQSSKFQPQ